MPRKKENDDNLPTSHDLRDWSAEVNVKATGSKIEKTIKRMRGSRLEMFKTSAFKDWVGLTNIKGNPLLIHKVMLHEIRPTANLKRKEKLRFQFGNHIIYFGPKQFCLITGFKFGSWHDVQANTIQSSFRQRCFPDLNDNDLKTGDLHGLIHSDRFFGITDNDAVTACLLYILCEGFLGREVNEAVTTGWLSLAEDHSCWNNYAWGSYLWTHSYPLMCDTFRKLHKHEALIKAGATTQKLKYSVSGFVYPFKVWIWETFPGVRARSFVKRLGNTPIPRIRSWQFIHKLDWDNVVDLLNHELPGCAPIVKLKVLNKEMEAPYYKQFKKFKKEGIETFDDPMLSPSQTKDYRSTTVDDETDDETDCSGGQQAAKVEMQKTVASVEEKVANLQEKIETLEKAYQPHGPKQDDSWDDMINFQDFNDCRGDDNTAEMELVRNRSTSKISRFH